MGVGGILSGSDFIRPHRVDAGAFSRQFAQLLGPDGTRTIWPTAGVIGLEHEYRVHVGAFPVDFRTLIHHLELGQRNLDPGDPNAYRLVSGAALTADETEAEIALAPMSTSPGCGVRLAHSAAEERRALASRLPDRTELSGYSTHLSVAVPTKSCDAVAKL